MTTANLNQGMPKLSEDQARVLAKKMEDFYTGLSPDEQAHVNLALRRMAADPSDVTGQAVLAEYATLLFLIATSFL